MENAKRTKNYRCVFCDNDNFEIPLEIIDDIKNNRLVIFAGAGISTEGKNVYKTTLYADINDELGESLNNTFPELMTKYCNIPNGRRKLINKIISRFEYYKSFDEIDNVMKQFFCPLADIYSIKEIITTNWDRQFEEKCGCMPIVYDTDIPLIDEVRRNVYKIHGSIDNIGSLIITESDYERCYNNLRENLLGSRIKYLLSNKTVLFIGYSMEDEDFKKIWEFIDDALKDLKPHFYIVSPDKNLCNKLKDKNITVINTIGSNFIQKIRQQLIDEQYIFDSALLYPLVEDTLFLAMEEHSKLSERFHTEKECLVIYSLSYQDGIIHSLKRMLSRECYGEYLNPNFLYGSIKKYDELVQDYMKGKNTFDTAYLCGYLHAMHFILYTYINLYNGSIPDKDDAICLYYLPNGKLFNNLSEYNNHVNNYKIKKYINIAERILKKYNNENFELVIHHPPFL